MNDYEAKQEDLKKRYEALSAKKAAEAEQALDEVAVNGKFNEALNAIVEAGGRPHLIGGSVRDLIVGVESKDLDIEVFGLTADQIIEALVGVGKPNIDDRKFGVIRLDCGLAEAVEFALPRKDNIGDRGFGGVFPNLTDFEAAFRRDFTFNAISWDLLEGVIIDPLNGRADLDNRIIRHCDARFFSQDPLRAIRGFRFAGLLNATVAPETAPIIRELVPAVKELTGDAMWSEFEKWAARSIKPSMGLRFMVDTGLIEVFPEIEALVGCPQDPEWHPEGDVFRHTCHVVDAAAGQGVVVVLAALCHDFGKPETTIKNPVDRWVSPGHATVGETAVRSFLQRIGAPKGVTEQVVELVREHMVHVGQAWAISKRQARRLLVRLENTSVSDLFKVIEADHNGRPPLPGGLPGRARELSALCDKMGNEVKPIIMGRHLVKMGITPGPHFGPILKRVFEAQLDGEFDTLEDGVTLLKSVTRHWLTQ